MSFNLLPQRDAAIERWGHMRENIHKNFRFTPRNSLFILITLVVVPMGLHSAIKWELRGNDRRKGKKPGQYF